MIGALRVVGTALRDSGVRCYSDGKDSSIIRCGQWLSFTDSAKDGNVPREASHELKIEISVTCSTVKKYISPSTIEIVIHKILVSSTE